MKQFLKLFMIGFCCLITPVSLHAAIKPNKTAVYIKKGDSTAIQITGAKSKVKWSSTNKNVASVTSTGKYKGSIKGINSGNAVIKSTDGKTSAKTNVYVMSITHSTLELTPSESVALSITNRNNGAVTWKSSNAKVAKVSSSGKVTAVAGGTATITGTCRGKSWTCKIYVPLLSLKSSTIDTGKTTTASVSNHISTIKYFSSNKSVATVSSNGTIKGISEGSAVITAKGYSGNKCVTQLSRTIKVQKAINPKAEMISLLGDLSKYAHGKNKNFSMITNVGYGLYCPSVNTNAASRQNFFYAVDGVLIEEVFYGWDGKMNEATPKEDQKEMFSAFLAAKNAGKPCFVLDYCTTTANKNNSYAQSLKKNLICYPSASRELNICPALPTEKENRNNTSDLKAVRNYLIILNPGNFSSKKAYLNAIKNTDYDMVFIDLFYDGKQLSKADVDSLKVKKNGAKRKICTYISIGEAEDYRYYWNSSWNTLKPSWIDKENPDWSGNYKVKYWSNEWKTILKGYFDKAINSGFDGAYLDVIDAYEYFE